MALSGKKVNWIGYLPAWTLVVFVLGTVHPSQAIFWSKPLIEDSREKERARVAWRAFREGLPTGFEEGHVAPLSPQTIQALGVNEHLAPLIAQYALSPLGRLRLQTMLLRPLVDPATIEARQNSVRAIAENDEMFEGLRAMFQNIAHLINSHGLSTNVGDGDAAEDDERPRSAGLYRARFHEAIDPDESGGMGHELITGAQTGLLLHLATSQGYSGRAMGSLEDIIGLAMAVSPLIASLSALGMPIDYLTGELEAVFQAAETFEAHIPQASEDPLIRELVDLCSEQLFCLRDLRNLSIFAQERDPVGRVARQFALPRWFQAFLRFRAPFRF